MNLTTEQLKMIVVDLVAGRDPPRITGPEADKFREELKPDLEKAKKNGWHIDVPVDD